MPLQICDKCSRFHYVPGECPAPKSTAALKEVRGPSNRETVPSKPPSEPQDAAESGYQAPPVDTPKKRGRPATGFDKKAHDRQKAKERRAAKKAKP
jgi:hypothetical protein